MSRSNLYRKTFVLLLVALIIAMPAMAQVSKQKSDTIAKKDTSLWVNGSRKELPKLNANVLKYKPDPKKAVLYSLMFPGLGQIYNKKYWKLPLVYGGFIGLTYAVSWNGKYYNDYSQAYKDIMSDDPYTNTSWFQFYKLRYSSVKDVTETELKSFQTQIKNRKNYYRRYRDLSIIGMVALYAACAIDAYVDAQLFDFDISDDVSIHVEPAVIPSQSNHVAGSALGVNCNIKF